MRFLDALQAWFRRRTDPFIERVPVPDVWESRDIMIWPPRERPAVGEIFFWRDQRWRVAHHTGDMTTVIRRKDEDE